MPGGLEVELLEFFFAAFVVGVVLGVKNVLGLGDVVRTKQLLNQILMRSRIELINEILLRKKDIGAVLRDFHIELGLLQLLQEVRGLDVEDLDH